MAQDELYKKGLKAFFKLMKDFLSLNPSVKTSTDVFDHTILNPFSCMDVKYGAYLIQCLLNLEMVLLHLIRFTLNTQQKDYILNFINPYWEYTQTTNIADCLI